MPYKYRDVQGTRFWNTLSLSQRENDIPCTEKTELTESKRREKKTEDDEGHPRDERAGPTPGEYMQGQSL